MTRPHKRKSILVDKCKNMRGPDLEQRANNNMEFIQLSKYGSNFSFSFFWVGCRINMNTKIAPIVQDELSWQLAPMWVVRVHPSYYCSASIFRVATMVVQCIWYCFWYFSFLYYYGALACGARTNYSLFLQDPYIPMLGAPQLLRILLCYQIHSFFLYLFLVILK